MGSPSPLFPFLLLFLLLLSNFLPTSLSEEATGFVYTGCSKPKYSPSSSSQVNLNSLLASIANAAASSLFANFTSSTLSSDDDATAAIYGLFQCRGDLTAPSCSSCVRAAINQLSLLCPSSSGATLQLKGCLVRYDNASFLGQPDKTLLFRKCGQPGQQQQDPAAMASRRDSALAAVAAGEGQGSYRVGRAGDVEAAAQCVEDQSAKQCEECVEAAVEAVKGACGPGSDAGEAYLGKCYVGYHRRVATGNAAAHHHGRDLLPGGQAKESGKNIAIIVGVAAAVLFLILLLYFLRKSTGGKG